MSTLLVCVCKEDNDVIRTAKDFYKNENCCKYFGCRSKGIEGQINMLKTNLTEIVVTAHGDKNEIGDKLPSFLDVTADGFAVILNKAGFSGKVYFDVCDGHAFGKNVKKSLTSGATIYGAQGPTGMDIDRSKCTLC